MSTVVPFPTTGLTDPPPQAFPGSPPAPGTLPAGRQLKCRWCAFTCPRWYTEASGRVRSGYDLLRKHVAEEHAEESVAIESAGRELESEFEAEQRRQAWAFN